MKKILTALVLWACLASAGDHPNILYILCDDLGYGDVQALNPARGRIPTPNLDRLVSQGMHFTDAHSGSSVCTPTRYGILTGRYAWRTRLQSGVLGGASPSLIAADRMTVASLLRDRGYTTACIGKWHLGLDWAKKANANPGGKKGEDWAIDYSKPFANGPVALGFDSYFGIAASLDMPPFVFLVNDRAEKPPTVEKKWLRSGAAAEDFEAVDVLPRLTQQACEFIAAHRDAGKGGKPFFIYLPLASPHTPIVPTKEWQGRSGLSDYADFVMQTDHSVGQIMKALDEHKLAEHTLVIFTSDNGCSPAANTEELEKKGHFASADRRGYKADVWDGGHRVPFIVRWPGNVKAGSSSSALVCLTDLMATCAEITGAKIPDRAGEDSVSILPLLQGQAAPCRGSVIHHSISGRFAMREANWKLELCPGSGGWSAPKDPAAAKQGLPPVQLYDMSADTGEQTNAQDQHPEVVARLTKLLEKHVAEGRSTPGAPQKNDVEVDVVKRVEKAKGK